MRIIIQYMTGNLQKRTDKISIPADSDTDLLQKLIAKKVNAKVSQLFIKFKRDGCILRIVGGWNLDVYQLKEGSILQVEQRESQSEENQKETLYRQKMLQKFGVKDLKQNQKLSVIKDMNEEDEDEEDSENESDNNKNSSQDDDDDYGGPSQSQTFSRQKIMDMKLENLLLATKQGDEQEIQQILENIPDIDDKEEIKQIQIQLINENGFSGWNPLHFAIFQGHFNIVRDFINRGADLNSLTLDNWTPLQLSVHRKNLEIVKLLVNSSDININQLTSRDSALHIACRIGNIEIIRILIENNADPIILNENMQTPMDVCHDKEIQGEYQKILDQKDEDLKKDVEQKENQNVPQGISMPLKNSPEKSSPVDNINQFPIVKRATRGLIPIPSRPPIIKGMAYKHGNWTLTIRKRFYVLNPDQGTLVRYKAKNYYPMKPMEVIPLSDIKYVQNIDRSWYMKGNIHYFEFTYNGQVYKMGFAYPETSKKWVFFLKESINYSKYMETQKERQGSLEPNSDIELMDDPAKDEQASQQFIHFMLGKHNQKRPQSPKAQEKQTQGEQKIQVYYNEQRTPTKRNSNQYPTAPQLPQKQQQQQQNGESNLGDNFSKRQQGNSKSKQQQQEQKKDQNTLDLGSLESKNVNYDSFKIIKLLGRGAFGKVFLAKKKDDEKIYALKALKKRQLIIKKQLKYAVTEANVLKMCDHPFVLKLHYAFQTPNYMYLALEYCPGGDLSLHLAQKVTFNEETSKFFTAELILAVEHIHEKDVVYRDLKPENILIDKEGHIKLADFGLSKDNVNDGDNTKSFCGSPAYLSPEMLGHHGAGKLSDIYGIGCVLFEMLTGDPPYYNDDIPKMYQNIQKGILKYPKNISNEAKDFMKKVLDRNPKTRLGAKGKQELKNHPFFDGIDWDKLARKQIPPPEMDFDLGDEDDEDEEELELMNNPNQNKPVHTDHDYTENNKRINRVINYTFHRPENE